PSLHDALPICLSQSGTLVLGKTGVGFELASQNYVQVTNCTTPEALYRVFFVIPTGILFGVHLYLASIIGVVWYEVHHAGYSLTTVQCSGTVGNNINALDGNGRNQQVNVGISNTFAVNQHKSGTGAQTTKVDVGGTG